MKVSLYHRALDRTIETTEGAARSLARRGWERVGEPQPEPQRRQGLRIHAGVEAQTTRTPPPERPAGNATRDEWKAYAEQTGVSVAIDMGRDAIRFAVEQFEQRLQPSTFSAAEADEHPVPEGDDPTPHEED